MAEVQPPAFLQAATYDALSVRRATTAQVRAAGIVTSGDLAVHPQATANMTVKVLVGQAYVPGTLIADQGHYLVTSDTDVDLALSPSDATNPRVDLVVARVNDSTYAGTEDGWVLEVVTGTAASSPQEPAPPANSYTLAAVDVAAGAGAIGKFDIDNRRAHVSFLSSRYATIYGDRRQGVVGTPPSDIYQFITVAGSEIVTTDGNGEATIDYPVPNADHPHDENFPSGVKSVVVSAGWGSPAYFTAVNDGGHTRTSFIVRCHTPGGDRLRNAQARINYIAVGW